MIAQTSGMLPPGQRKNVSGTRVDIDSPIGLHGVLVSEHGGKLNNMRKTASVGLFCSTGSVEAVRAGSESKQGDSNPYLEIRNCNS